MARAAAAVSRLWRSAGEGVGSERLVHGVGRGRLFREVGPVVIRFCGVSKEAPPSRPFQQGAREAPGRLANSLQQGHPLPGAEGDPFEMSQLSQESQGSPSRKGPSEL
jgi:hypothetical protein